jgi:hypothetical protein
MKQSNDFEHRVTELIEASIATKQSLLRSPVHRSRLLRYRG